MIADLLKKYQSYIRNSGMKVNASLWIAFSLVISLLVGFVCFILLPSMPMLALLFFIVFLDLLIAFPYMKELQRIDAIEDALPDALRQMSDTLKAGGTYEYALREIASSEYGPLKKIMDTVLRKLEEGENFETALSYLAEDVDSRLIKRTVTIIVDSVKAGAGLADILEQIAEDVRTMHRIGRERRSRTMLQTIFIFFAGAVVAPAIFGFSTTIVDVLVRSTSSVSPEKAITAKYAVNMIFIGVQAYLFIETAAAASMIALMREGKISKSLLYFPILIFIAYIAYVVAGIASKAFLG